MTVCLLFIGFALWAARSEDSPKSVIAGEEGGADPGAPVEELATPQGPGRREPTAAADPTASADHAGSRCRIVVTTDSNEPVQGAGVSIQKGWILLGQTDMIGEVWTSRKPLAGARLLIRGAGHVPQLIEVPSPAPDTIPVRLREGWSLAGRVVDPSGNLVGPGVRVLSVSPGDDLTVGRVRASMLGHGPLLMATTDVNGEFALKGLDPKMGYRLFAGGQGYCSADPLGKIVHVGLSEGPFELTAYPAYGLRVRIREKGGLTPKIGSELGGKWWGTPAVLVEDAKTIMSGPWTAELLGVDPGAEGSSFDRTNYFITASDHGSSIDVSFEAQYPGYEPTSARLAAVRVRDELPVHDVTIVPTCAGFGSVVVWLEPAEALPQVIPGDTSVAPPMLILRNAAGEGVEIKASLEGIERGHRSVDGVPFGMYSVQFRAPHQLFRHPKNNDGPVFLSVDSRKEDLRVPLVDLGSLALNVLNQDGTEYVGPIRGTHVTIAGGWTDGFYFPSPPYSIPMLPHGDYTISVYVGGEEVASKFSIVESEITQLTVQVP